MTIAIDLTPLYYHITGVERYAFCISEEMLLQDLDNEYLLVFKEEIYSGFAKYIDGKRIKAIILHGNNKILFNIFKRSYGFKKIKADKYLFFACPSPIFFDKPGIINTIHDLAAWDVPRSMRFFQREYSRILRRKTTPISDAIITVSEFSKKRIFSILKYPMDKIHVIPNGIPSNLMKYKDRNDPNVMRNYGIPQKYILALSTLEPKKNLDFLLRIYDSVAEDVDYDLVLVGRNGWKNSTGSVPYSHKDRIHITGFISDEDVSQLYKNALCFVFPSIYEGFGIPPLEALAFHTPVIASNAASIPEVLMDRATYFDCKSDTGLSKLLLNLNCSVEMMPRSLNDHQIKEFDYSRSAKKVIDLINYG